MALGKKLRSVTGNALLVNTAMLYLLSFSNALLTFLTQGYLTRVLGLDKMGILGAARYATALFQLVIDFGYILSATAKVAQHREDKSALNRLLTCVTWGKLAFMAGSYGVLLVLVAPGLKEPGALAAYGFYLLYVCMAALLPDFIYRGLERMKEIAVKAVLIKLAVSLSTFVLVRRPDQYWMAPLISAVGNAGATLFVYWHLKTKVGLSFCRVSPREVLREMKDAGQFFFSRVFASVNSNLNGVLLKAFAGAVATGVYSQADVVITAARSAMTPIADSLYAHTVASRDLKPVRRTFLLLFPVVLAGCGAVYLLAPWLLETWLGPEAGPQSVLPLRLMLPAAALAFPNNLLGFPVLAPLGLVKYVNLSVGFGTAVYLAGLGVCLLTGGVTLTGLCVLTSVTELAILAFRVGVLLVHRRKRLGPEPSAQALASEED